MTVLEPVAVHTFHLVLVDSMYRMALHSVCRNWDKLLVDSRFGMVVNSTYLADADCMGDSSLPVDMLDSAFDGWVVGMDRVLVVDNGMFVDEAFLLKKKKSNKLIWIEVDSNGKY